MPLIWICMELVVITNYVARQEEGEEVRKATETPTTTPKKSKTSGDQVGETAYVIGVFCGLLYGRVAKRKIL